MIDLLVEARALLNAKGGGGGRKRGVPSKTTLLATEPHTLAELPQM